MNNIANALTLLLLAVLVPTAVLDIMRNPRVLATTSRLGIPEEKVPVGTHPGTSSTSKMISLMPMTFVGLAP